MIDLPNLDVAGWIALALLLIIALAWWPVLREIPGTVIVLFQLAAERRRPPEPIPYDPGGHATANAELQAERLQRAARGLEHAERAKARRVEAGL